MPTRTKLAIIAPFALLLCLYIASYTAMSVRGQYEPAIIGADHVKLWAWAPDGFAPNGLWRPRLIYVYAPLYLLDTRLWHTGWDSDDDPNENDASPGQQFQRTP